MDMEILSSEAEGFRAIKSTEHWTVAIINDSTAMHLANVESVSRHNETDEVFVLLAGEACVYVGSGEENPVTLRRCDLEIGKAFVVTRGSWHATVTTPGCKIFVTENAGTGVANTDRIPVSDVKFED